MNLDRDAFWQGSHHLTHKLALPLWRSFTCIGNGSKPVQNTAPAGGAIFALTDYPLLCRLFYDFSSQAVDELLSDQVAQLALDGLVVL